MTAQSSETTVTDRVVVSAVDESGPSSPSVSLAKEEAGKTVGPTGESIETTASPLYSVIETLKTTMSSLTDYFIQYTTQDTSTITKSTETKLETPSDETTKPFGTVSPQTAGREVPVEQTAKPKVGEEPTTSVIEDIDITDKPDLTLPTSTDKVSSRDPATDMFTTETGTASLSGTGTPTVSPEDKKSTTPTNVEAGEENESAVTIKTEKSSFSPVTAKTDISPGLTAREEGGSGEGTTDMFSKTYPVTPTPSLASTEELSTMSPKTVVDVSDQTVMSSTSVVSDITKTSSITSPPSLGSPKPSIDSGYEILDYGDNKEPVMVESSPSFSGPSTKLDKAAVSTSTDKEDSGDLASTLFTDESLIVSTTMSSMFSTEKPVTTASDETTDSLKSTVTAPSSLYSTEKPAFTTETQESVSKDQTSIAAEAISTLATTEVSSGGLIFDVSTKEPVSVSASSTSMFSTEKPSVTTESHVTDSSRTTPSPASSLYSTERPTSISSESQHSFTTSKSETYSVTPEASSVLLSTLEEGSGDPSSDVSTQETVTVTSSSMFSTEGPEKEAAAVTISTTSASSSYSTEKATAISTEQPEQTSKDTSQGSETLASTASSLFSTEKPTMLTPEVEQSAVTVQTEKSSVSPITEKTDMSPGLTATEEVGSGDATPDMFSQTTPVTPTSSQASTGELSTVLSKTVVDVSDQTVMSSTSVFSDVTTTSPITSPPRLETSEPSTDSGYEILDYGVSKEPVLVESSPSFSGPSTEPDKAAVSTSTDKEDSGDLASTLFTDESLIVSTTMSSMFSTEKPSVTPESHVTDSSRTTPSPASSLYSTERPTSISSESHHSFTTSKSETYPVTPEASSILLSTLEEGSGDKSSDVSTQETVTVTSSSMFSTEEPEKEAATVTISTTSASSSYSTEKATAISTEQPEQTSKDTSQGSETLASTASSLFSTEKPTMLPSEVEESAVTVQTEKSSVSPITDKTDMSPGLTATEEVGSGDATPDMFSQTTPVTPTSSQASTGELSTVLSKIVVDVSDQTVMSSTSVVSDVTTTSPITSPPHLGSPEPSTDSGYEILNYGVSKEPVLVESSSSFSGPSTEPDKAAVSTSTDKEDSGDLASTLFTDESLIVSTTMSSMFSTEKPVTTASDETTDSLKSTVTAPSSLYSTEKPAFKTETQESVSKDQTSIAAEAISTLATTEEGSGGLIYDASTKEPVSVSASSTSMFSTEKPSVTTESHVTDSSRTTPSPASSLYSTERPTSISSESQHSFTTSKSETYSVTPEASSVLLSTLEEGSGDPSSDVSTQETVTVTSSSMFSTEEPEKEAAAVTISTTSASSSYSTEKATAISTEQPEQTSKDTSQGSETLASTASSLFSTEKPTMLTPEVEESAVTVQTEKSSVSPIIDKTDMSHGLTATEEVGSGDATPDMFSQTTPVTPTSSQASTGELSTVLSKIVVDVSDQTVMSSTSVVSDVTTTSPITSPPHLGSPEPSTDSGYEILDYGVSKEPVLVESSPSFSGPSTEPDKAAVSTSTDKEDSGDLASTLFTDESLIVSTTMSSMFSTEKPVTTASDETTDSLKSTVTAPSSLYSTEKPAFTTETQESVSKDQTSIAAEAISTLATTEEGSGGLIFDVSTKEPVSVSASSTSMFSTEKPSVTTESHVTDSSRTTPSPASSLYSTERPTSISSESQHSFTTSKSETYSVTPEASSVLLSTLEEGSGDPSSDVSTQETVTVTSSSMFSTEEPEKEAAAVTISTISASSSYSTEKATAISTEQPEQTSKDTSQGIETLASTASSLFSTDKPTMLTPEVEESAVTVQTEKSSVSPITDKTDMSPGLTATEEVGSGDATPDMFSQTTPVTPTSSQASTGELSTVLSKIVVDVSDQTVMSSTSVVSDVTTTSPITSPPHLGSPEPSTDSGYEILDYGVSKEPVLVESSPSFSGPSTEPDKAAVSTSTDKEDSGDLASTLFTDESLIVSTTMSSMFSTEKPVTTASDETTDSLKSTGTAPSSLYSTEKPAFTTETQESVSKDQTSIAAEAISTLATTEEGSGGLIFDVSTKEPVSVSASSTSMFSTEKPSVTTESHVTDISRTTPSPASSLYSTERPTSISSESHHSFTTSKSETYPVTPEASSVLLSTLEEGSGDPLSDVSTQETVTVTSSSMFSTEEPEKEAAAVTISTTSASSLLFH